jgi:hypothetical protein
MHNPIEVKSVAKSNFAECPAVDVVDAASADDVVAEGASVTLPDLDCSTEDAVLGTIVYPNRSVVGGGNVVICAAGNVTSTIVTALLAVSIHKQVGFSVTVQSPIPPVIS